MGRTKQTTLSQEGPIVAVAGVVVMRCELPGIYRRSAQRVRAESSSRLRRRMSKLVRFPSITASSEYRF